MLSAGLLDRGHARFERREPLFHVGGCVSAKHCLASKQASELIELELADGTSDADIEAMCRKLLANTVIENFRVERLEQA